MHLITNEYHFTDNSQEINKDIIFVSNNYNKKYIEQVKQAGCKRIIASSQLKDFFDFSPIKIIGITGTNGKTTTAAAIYSFLLDLGYKVALQGTRGFFINDERIEEYSLTTPMQVTNFSHIQKAIKNECDFFIMEVSSHAIAQNRIEGLTFELKIHTNITRDHLDYHNTIEEYINIKNSFFSDDGKKLINKDDPKVNVNRKNAYAYSLDKPSTYKVQAYSFKEGMQVAISHIGEMVNFSSSMMGIFNIYNLTAAIAAVDIVTNKNLEEICLVVENFAGVEGRMEIISKEPLIIVDFAHTPDGMKEVFESFNHKDIIVVFGAGGDRDQSKRAIMGKMAATYAKHIIITSDNPRFEDPDLIVSDILSGIKNKQNVKIDINRKAAIAKAIALASKDSVVLVLGKGDESTQTIYDKKFPLLDKKIILDCLANQNIK
ncbi:MAG: UDP-N-acetylmuramoyl-L-alanyl-D-glutamate--2,6-diaminopimelate ligase [Campylobacteraceae bacterium]|nr:UDP-N-acetylmuramoyl-L-alanyl-D-glutamate--2,6-diaminopimelate ligase [Campylobacteraceae bacterium]